MTVEICLVNLGNTGEFKYYEVDTLEALNEAYDNMRAVFNADEIEIQGMSHSDRVVSYLGDLLEMTEENDADLEDAINILEATGCIEATREAIKNGSYSYYEAEDKESAFIEYLEDTCYFEGIPERVINYLNYKMIMQDFEIEGLQIEWLDYNKYLFIH
ncbi:TPA: hypothetical protein KOX39_003421 [Clostridioides difficile]|nr:hypothetical protein [Clostridioides difficile]